MELIPDQTMRSILLINYEYPPIGGGAAQATSAIAAKLSHPSRMTRVTVLTSRFKNQLGWTEENGVSVYRCRSRRNRKDQSNIFEMASFVFFALWALPSIVRKKKPDGVIVFFSLPCGPLGLFLKLFYRIPYVVSLRGGDVPGTEKKLALFHTLLSPLRRIVLQKSRAVVANAQGLADLSKTYNPIPVQVIYNGIDETVFQPPQEPDQSTGLFRILFVGRFQEQKNINLLLEQYARIRGKMPQGQMELYLVGDGPLRFELERTAKVLSLENAIQWHGWVDRNALVPLYHQAHCFINVSLYEGVSNSMLEAMACALPVIASNVIGNNEVVVNGETGYLFDLGVPEQCGDRLVQLASCRETAIAMGSKARERAVKMFSWDHVADTYLSFFNR
jgi:glycosyltransferase involved in cell wall biosynthesis